MNDLLAELKRLKRDSESGTREPVGAAPQRGRRAVVTILALAAMVVLAAALFLRGRPEIFVPRVGRTLQITREAGLEIDGIISPDGKMVAYAAGPLNATNIYVQQVAGGRPVPLTEGFPGAHRGPHWSPDGTRIAFTTNFGRGTGRIHIVPALGGAPRRFPSDGQNLVWSPNGESVAYLNSNAIFVAAADGSEPRKVMDALEPSSLSWSPNGVDIAFALGHSAGSLNIAPSSIWVVPATGGEPARVTEDAHLDISPVWTRDGKSLLFVSDRGGARDIYRVPVDPARGSVGDPERLTTGLDVLTIALSVDGRLLSYSVIDARQNLWSIPVPKAGPVSIAQVRPVTTGNQMIEGVDVSADGKWLVFDSNRSGNQDIFKVPVDGGEPVQLTTDPAIDCCPSWSPDGKEVAFHTFRTGSRDIFMIASDGGTARPITNDPAEERYPHWSPDGLKIVFTWASGNENGIYVVSKDRGELAVETPQQLVAGAYGRWSPDGRLIAYTSMGDDTQSWRARKTSIAVISPDGGEPRTISEFGRRPKWSPDGETIFFRVLLRNDRAGIWSVPLSGGEPELLVDYDDPSRIPIRGEWSTDGENFYFTLTEYESDVWVMELDSPSK